MEEKLMYSRKENWSFLLSEYISEIWGKEFAYPDFDCAGLAAGCVEKLTGKNPLKKIKSKYKTEKQAFAFVKKFGSLENTVSNFMGFQPSQNKFSAKRGDVIIASLDQKDALGFVDDTGKEVIVFVNKFPAKLPLETIKLVWSF